MNPNEFSFTLDGREIAFEPGQTVIEAATQAGAYIPHLCYHPDLSVHGSCKLCTVKVNGRLVSACTQPAQAGATVENDTSELRRDRQRLLQMLFVEGNHFCPFCEKSGSCQLQAQAYLGGMQELHFVSFFPRRAVDASHPEVWLDRDRCINCALCVRASNEVDHKNVFGMAGRGMDTHLVVNSRSGLLGDTDLAATDLAANICPTGALLPKRHGYVIPIGERPYDCHTIAEVCETPTVELKP